MKKNYRVKNNLQILYNQYGVGAVIVLLIIGCLVFLGALVYIKYDESNKDPANKKDAPMTVVKTDESSTEEINSFETIEEDESTPQEINNETLDELDDLVKSVDKEADDDLGAFDLE